MTTAYGTDLALWAEQQAALIAAGEWDAVDRENVADEISSLARADKRDIADHLCRLLENQMKIAANLLPVLGCRTSTHERHHHHSALAGYVVPAAFNLLLIVVNGLLDKSDEQTADAGS